MGVNESANRATNMAIQAAVVEMIREGQRKGFWEYDPKSVEEIRLAQEEKEAKKLINRIKSSFDGKEKNSTESKTNMTVSDSGVTVKSGENK